MTWHMMEEKPTRSGDDFLVIYTVMNDGIHKPEYYPSEAWYNVEKDIWQLEAFHWHPYKDVIRWTDDWLPEELLE